jgi:DNA-binding transcriptional regulator YiaG
MTLDENVTVPASHTGTDAAIDSEDRWKIEHVVEREHVLPAATKTMPLNLSPDQIDELRRRYAAREGSERELAAAFGISNATVSRLVREQSVGAASREGRERPLGSDSPAEGDRRP